MAKADTRDRIVDAAMTIVRERGPARLTLDEAARVANVSKGGVLYHFKSKDELIREMVHRMIDRCDTLSESYFEEEEDNPYRWNRAMIHTAFDPRGPGNDPVGAAVLAAITLNPDLMEPLRAKFLEWDSRIIEGSPDPDLAILVDLALNGLFLNRVTGLNRYDDAQLDRLKAKALSLLTV
ncbi:MAG: TetR family transcriptional regulator [Rhodospirillum sp.]|nr:TetR family transcriptional regulator [Rhodospirillum sp.]MCF8487612.1 TetR family transcriptional regulator [Rhodospirillum sp.]MCF8499216.1 TetR family transcriptional regulator [Rhodospirillum sp.]